jgi:phage/plasmid-associated DNA primase
LSVKLDTTVLTGKKPSSGSANSELARTGNGVRLIVMEEPNTDEKINIGVIKHLTGGDSYFARDLFETGKGTSQIEPMFKMIMIANDFVCLKDADNATWNRVVPIFFESVFVKPGGDLPATYEEQLRQKRFPMDIEFDEKIPGMLEPLAYMLLERLKTKRNTLYPDKVSKAIEQYKKFNDNNKDFINECLIEDSTKSISIAELYGLYKAWHKDSFPNYSIPIKNDVQKYFTRTWGEPMDGVIWKGYRSRSYADKVQSGDAFTINVNMNDLL